MNKGLEVIEAHHLFGLPYERIEVVVHPQSLVHALVRLVDGALLAHLGMPDMRVPIAYALHYPRAGARWPTAAAGPGRGRCLGLRGPPTRRRSLPSGWPARPGQAGTRRPARSTPPTRWPCDAFLDGRLSFLGIPRWWRRVARAAGGGPPRNVRRGRGRRCLGAARGRSVGAASDAGSPRGTMRRGRMTVGAVHMGAFVRRHRGHRGPGVPDPGPRVRSLHRGQGHGHAGGGVQPRLRPLSWSAGASGRRSTASPCCRWAATCASPACTRRSSRPGSTRRPARSRTPLGGGRGRSGVPQGPGRPAGRGPGPERRGDRRRRRSTAATTRIRSGNASSSSSPGSP